MIAMVGASIMAGELDRAERDLRRWTDASGPTLRTWLGELLWRRNDLEGAKRELNRVQNEIRDYMAAKLLWVQVKGKLDDERYVTTTAYDGLLEGQLQAFGIDPRLKDGILDSNELRAAAADILERMQGNRSPFPSIVRDGRLMPIRVPSSPRHRAAEVQHRARYVGLDRAKEEIVAELARIGPHPIAECYEAELYLWSGDYEIARAKFEKILAAASQTTWAWIGLGASQVLLGDAAAGLRSLDEGVKVMGWRGATLPVYRGEASFRLGRLDEAAAELAEACQMQPGRVGAWVLRFLTENACGNAEQCDAIFAHLDAAAPALLSDAARAAGIDGWWQGPPPSRETQLRVVEQTLDLMRGNRSSSCPIWIAQESGAVRSFLHQRPVTTPGWEQSERRSLAEL
jgi:tetratricopeptide (TPR) repeat protein